MSNEAKTATELFGAHLTSEGIKTFAALPETRRKLGIFSWPPRANPQS